jgi:hypothetical protein
MTHDDIDTLTNIRMPARYLTLHRSAAVRGYAEMILSLCNDAEDAMKDEPLVVQSLEGMISGLKGALSYGTGK